MEIACRSYRRCTILDLAGRHLMTAGETEILPLRSTIDGLIAQGRVQIALNLEEIASVDARALGELVTIYLLLRAAGGSLTLVAPNARVRKMLAVTRLDTFIPVWDREPHAFRTAGTSTRIDRCAGASGASA